MRKGGGRHSCLEDPGSDRNDAASEQREPQQYAHPAGAKPVPSLGLRAALDITMIRIATTVATEANIIQARTSSLSGAACNRLVGG